MTVSVVSICNRALDLLKRDTIASLTDDSEEARLCNRNYALVRDAVLRSYPWNSAMARASLPALAEAPAWGYDRQFQMPEGPEPPYCLRVYEINGEVDYGYRYKVEGRKILTNEAAPLEILYISRVEDPALFDALLADTISARLAAELAYPLTGSTTLMQAMMQAYQEKLADARQVDSHEGTPDPLDGNRSVDWLRSRY